jgi:long-chain acyl-CoA synthetase
VKIMQVWEGDDLPRTAKRSVKRREVVAELQAARKKVEETSGAIVAAVRADESSVGWLLDTVATVSGRRRGDVALSSRFDQLGFDSLMYAELSSAFENAGVTLPESVDITTFSTVAELQQVLARGHLVGAKARGEGDAGKGADGEIRVPDFLARLGKRGLAMGQRLLYEGALDTTVRGANHIPQHTNFIVAANHASHLDQGVIKVALGEAGQELTSLAAADYFFRNKYRRAFFKHFTNLVPMERSGSIRKSMDTAEKVLRQGRSMVVFPEGTRSTSGEMADFLPSLGYLALRAEVGILPAYISGAYEALPKGSAVPRARELGVTFGPFLTREWLAELTKDLTAQEGWRLAAAFAQRIVENLRDGVTTPLDVEAARAAWDGQTQKLGPLQTRRRRTLRSVS